MSNAVFPSLPGLTWNVVKSPQWKTKPQQAVSGREVRVAFRSMPLYRFAMGYEVLREEAASAELQTLIGFFNARQGSYDSFLYIDPSDSAVASQAFGTGNGSTAAFQLVRSYGGHSEPVMNLNGAPAISVAGVLKATPADYSINSLGMVTFVVPPAAAAALTWTGSYYHRCRFMADAIDFDNFLYQLWQLKKLELLGCLGSKI